MSEYCTEYSNFNDLVKREPELAKELLEKVDRGDWQNDSIYMFECVEDVASYELTEGCYTHYLSQDIDDAPDLLNYINLTKLGNALVYNWDIPLYFLASDGAVLSTECGW